MVLAGDTAGWPSCQYSTEQPPTFRVYPRVCGGTFFTVTLLLHGSSRRISYSLVFSTLGVVQMPHKFTVARRHKFDKVQYRVINWAEY